MQIKSTKDYQKKKFNFCVYGKSKTGKTMLLSTVKDKILMLNTDKGELTLSDSDIDFVDCNTWKDISDFMRYLGTPECVAKYRWIAFDSMSVIAKILYIDLKDNQKMTGFELWREFGDKLQKILSFIRDQELYHTISIFEAKVTQDANGINLFSFGINGQTNLEIPHYFDIVMSTHKKTKEGKTTYNLQLSETGGWIGGDRSRKLDTNEEPNLDNIMNKILGQSKPK